MSIQFILIVAVLVAALLAGLAFVRRRPTEGGVRQVPAAGSFENAQPVKLVRQQGAASKPGFVNVIAWSLAGAVIGGAVIFFGLLAYDLLFEPSKDAAVQGFQMGAAMLTGVGGAVVGFVIGTIVGVIRIRAGNSPRS